MKIPDWCKKIVQSLENNFLENTNVFVNVYLTLLIYGDQWTFVVF